MEIIFAAIVSALGQILKRETDNEYFILGMVALFSITAAAIYCGLVAAGFWQTAVQIMTIAGAIYTFIIARFESQPTQG